MENKTKKWKLQESYWEVVMKNRNSRALSLLNYMSRRASTLKMTSENTLNIHLLNDYFRRRISSSVRTKQLDSLCLESITSGPPCSFVFVCFCSTKSHLFQRSLVSFPVCVCEITVWDCWEITSPIWIMALIWWIMPPPLIPFFG